MFPLMSFVRALKFSLKLLQAVSFRFQRQVLLVTLIINLFFGIFRDYLSFVKRNVIQTYFSCVYIKLLWPKWQLTSSEWKTISSFWCCNIYYTHLRDQQDISRSPVHKLNSSLSKPSTRSALLILQQVWSC